MSDGLEKVRPGVVFPLDDVDLAQLWLAVVHDVVRRLGGRVLGPAEAPRVDRSFHAVPVLVSGGTLTLLLNTGARLVAAVVGERPFPATADYTEVPAPEAFEAVGLHVAPPEDMSADWTDRHLAQLDGEEAQQVAYHRPSRVGDVIFNWFD